MASTYKKVSDSLNRKQAREAAALGLVDCTPEHIQDALRILEGRWKMVILFHLFHHPKLRFSELERAIPAVTQKMLIQQLRGLQRDGVVERKVYAQVPPKVEYQLTRIGRALKPALFELLKWSVRRQRAVTPSGVRGRTRPAAL